MARGLTTKGVEAVKPDPARRIEIPDPALSGLYLVVQISGLKSWAVRYRFAGATAKLTLGRWPAMGLAEARAAGAEALEKVERGVDPAAEKKVAKAAPAPDRNTFEAVVADFMKRHASRNRRADDVAAMFRREVAQRWNGRAIQSITKRDILEVLDGIVDRGSPITANRLRASLNVLFNWAKGRDIIKENPLDGVRPPAPENSRDRVLTDREIVLLWGATDAMWANSAMTRSADTFRPFRAMAWARRSASAGPRSASAANSIAMASSALIRA